MSEEKYRQLIESVELTKIELLSLNSNQNRNFPTEKKGNLDIALKNEIVESKVDGIELQAEIEFEIIAFHTDDSNEPEAVENIHEEDILFRVEFSLVLNYVFDLENPEDIMLKFDKEMNTFVEKNVPLNAWPYARETISSITTRMGFPGVIIPTYKNLPPH